VRMTGVYLLRSLLFWDVMQCRLVVCYHVSGQLTGFTFKGHAVLIIDHR